MLQALGSAPNENEGSRGSMEKTEGLDFNTRLLHAAGERDPYTGAVSTPIYQVSTFHQDLDHPGPFDYSRSGNPTRKELENLIANLEHGAGGFAFASGMAATTAVLMLFAPGDHLVVSEDLYGGTFRALTKVFSRWGLEVTFVETADTGAVESAIQANTKGLFIETPSNPLLKISDLKALIDIGAAHGILTIVDNTFLTPYYCRPLEWGADLVIHSGTKFLNGHSDVVAGLVVAREDKLAKEVYFIQNALGAVLGPQDSWLLIRGLKTLGIRLEQQSKNAMVLAEWLETQDWVAKVFYPGLPGYPDKEKLEKVSSGYGAIVTFIVKEEAVFNRLLHKLTLPAIAVSLGAVESILTHPATMSHAAMPAEERAKRGIADRLLRLSVGLETPADIMEDFSRAIQGV